MTQVSPQTPANTLGNTIGDNDNDDVKSNNNIENDVILSLKGVPEYDHYPYSKGNPNFLFMASIKAPKFQSTMDRAPIDLVCVIDESSSMEGDRIKLVKETINFIINNLQKNDRFGCVGYSSIARNILKLTKMDNNGKLIALKKCKRIRASGCTALCAGLVDGVNMLRNRDPNNCNSIASCMLFTDGQANEGPTDATSIIQAIEFDQIQLSSNSNDNYNINNKYISKMQQMQQQINQLQQQIKYVNMSSMNMNMNMNMNDPDPDPLPCTINTFGFGSDHNSSLLSAIAERGRGMYAFIKDNTEIGETFAEALGGLVSIVGQNIKITIEALNGIQINKCLSKGFNSKIIKKNQIQQIVIPDIQSEESRDIVFDLNINLLNKVVFSYPIIKLKVEYLNTIKDKNEILNTICTLDRTDNNDIGERNIELDIQYNRLIAANAMKTANDYAKKGKLNAARFYIKNAQNVLSSSPSNSNPYIQALDQDLAKCSKGLKNTKSYNNIGNQMLASNSMSHFQQRSCQTPRFTSQSAYSNSVKSALLLKSPKTT